MIPTRRHAANGDLEKAIFAAGCFWQVEEVFRHLPGVKKTMVGYTGGTTPNPSYEEVCTGKTGHAEAVEVTYEPREISFEKLLDVFWENHDPTELDRQGPDVGRQYRSAIFYATAEQQHLAEGSKADLERSGKFAKPVVTRVLPAGSFYPAEDYHQQYLEKRGLAPDTN